MLVFALREAANGVKNLASCLFSVGCDCDVLLGKMAAARFLKRMAIPATYRSTRCFPSFRRTCANGVTMESGLGRCSIREGVALGVAIGRQDVGE